MGQIRKVGDIYYIEFFARGLIYSQVGGSNEAEAKRLLEEIERKIDLGESLTVVREIDLGVFFQKFVEEAQRRFSLKSTRRFTSSWNNFSRFLNDAFPQIRQISQVTPSVIESYKIHLIKSKVNERVINLTILLLREILEYGIRISFINDNPTLHISLIEMQPRPIRTGRRLEIAKDLLGRGVSLSKVYEILKLKDVAQIMYWSNFIPLKREDVYTM